MKNVNSVFFTLPHEDRCEIRDHTFNILEAEWDVVITVEMFSEPENLSQREFQKFPGVTKGEQNNSISPSVHGAK